MEDYKQLIDCIRKEEVTLFLGSGFSLKAGAPSASDMVDAIMNAMTQEERESSKRKEQLDTIAEEYEQMHERESLLSILENLMSFKRTDMSDYECLKKIPHIHQIITTNYDTLIEDCYGKDNVYVVRKAEDCTNIPKDKIIIYKIHGDFAYKKNLIITKQDYTNFFSNQKEPLLWKLIQSNILTKDILFIGYSLEDSNIFEIMKEIKKAVNGKTRQFFLLAPGLLEYKIRRLAKTNVKYYDAKAEDLFPYIFSSLDKNIYKDYKRKKISLTTLSKYSNGKNLDPIASEGEKCNKVHFVSKGPIDIQLNGLIDKSLYDRLANDDISLYTEFRPNTLIPAIKLGRDKFKTINIEYNGMIVGTEEDFSFIYLSPVSEQKEVSFRILETGFNEKASITQFKINNCATITSKLESFTLKFEFTFKGDGSLLCTYTINLINKYKNNSEAIKWIELPIAIMEGKEVTISSMYEIPKMFEIPKIIFENNESSKFKSIREYYKNIKEIELLYGVEFKEYTNYSIEAFEKSKALIQSYKKLNRSLKIKNKEGYIEGNFQFIDKQKFPKNQSCSFALLKPSKNIEFNGQKFTLKDMYIILPDCYILSTKMLDNNKTKLKIKINTDFIYLIYTDKDANINDVLKNKFLIN